MKIVLSKLDNARKRELWEWIKEHRPELAEFMEGAGLKEFKDLFDASIVSFELKGFQWKT